MHTAVPVAIKRDRKYAVMHRFEIIHSVHHGIDLPPFSGRDKTFGG